MSPLILAVTAFLLALPGSFLVAALVAGPPLALPALLMIAIYAWVWLRFRPSRFVVQSRTLEVVWPLRRRSIARDQIAAVRIVDAQELRREIGFGVRVGAGGLFGGFGWLWTRRRGRVQMYVSRTDRFVWIELASGPPWLITPDRPEDFVRALAPGR
jgi:hypothetical protein